ISYYDHYQCHPSVSYSFFFFNDTATTEIYTLSLHDALPISSPCAGRPETSRPRRTPTPARACGSRPSRPRSGPASPPPRTAGARSEEHTSELQSRGHLVCRLLLEKKKKKSEKMT